ncbi:MAG: hypothetical protein CL693_19225 [Cellvibrionaceae bacterium]|nr:hypothetical protein [Cellvibrionaceae bacterium]|tara:strand:- start:86863 stop:87351 length:489 start_codon:yes stop_codon:yes gene_type:complete
MWLPIVICLAAVALLLGPIMLMQPSAGQRREALLRQRAIDLGLRVHLQVPPTGTDVARHIKSLPMYCLPWTDQRDTRHAWSLVKKKYEHELHCQGRWDWEMKSENPNVNQILGRLEGAPEKVMAVVGGPQGLCGFWNELGSETDVEEIAQWLKESSELIKSG